MLLNSISLLIQDFLLYFTEKNYSIALLASLLSCVLLVTIPFLSKRASKPISFFGTICVFLYLELEVILQFFRGLSKPLSEASEAISAISVKVNTPSSFTSLSTVVVAILLFSAIFVCVILFSSKNLEDSRISSPEVYPMILLITSGLIFAISSTHLFGIYLSMELSSMLLYILLALEIRGDKSKSNKITAEVSVKYFMAGVVISAISLYGLSLLYIETKGGSLTLESLNANLSSYPAVLSILLFSLTFFYKSSIFPFHLWTIDVYQGSSNAVILLLSNVVKITSLFILHKIFGLYILNVASPFNGILITIISTMLLASVLSGSIGALRQTNLKRMAAYSGTLNLGFAGVFILSSNTAYLVLYLLIYSTNIGFFASLEMISRRNKEFDYDLESINGLGKTNPILAFALTVTILSIAGIPPLAGFFIKFLSIVSLVNIYSIGTAFAVLFALSSAIALYFYLKILRAIYMKKPSEFLSTQVKNKSDFLLSIAIVISILFITTPVSLLIVPIFS